MNEVRAAAIFKWYFIWCKSYSSKLVTVQKLGLIDTEFSRNTRKNLNFWKNRWRHECLASNSGLLLAGVLSSLKILNIFRKTCWLSQFLPSQQFYLTKSSCPNFLKSSFIAIFQGTSESLIHRKENCRNHFFW